VVFVAGVVERLWCVEDERWVGVAAGILAPTAGSISCRFPPRMDLARTVDRGSSDWGYELENYARRSRTGCIMGGRADEYELCGWAFVRWGGGGGVGWWVGFGTGEVSRGLIPLKLSGGPRRAGLRRSKLTPSTAPDKRAKPGRIFRG